MRVPTPSTMHAATVLGGVKGALAALGGYAALDAAFYKGGSCQASHARA
jgi:hypothetical protein